ncbi:hypothetical protein BsIDN1_23460 [Bacillus safensis]|uniref:Uncharacterized protein n=1 Tax=Bacillus safensis TaxID=561879 RepID=A0A5S9M784_BACIA|nr:hypothetical protein BsIDN1_23460 [Bacillus safensis]
MMMTDEQKHEFYQALVDKNPQYDGTFFLPVLRQLASSVMPHVRLESQNLKTVSFSLQRRKHCWQGIALASAAHH